MVFLLFVSFAEEVVGEEKEELRGGNEINRGGNEMTRGGDEMNRGGNAPPCFFKADVSRRKCRQYFSTLPNKVLNLCKYLGIFKEKQRRKKRQCLRSLSPFAPKSKEIRTKALPVRGVTTWSGFGEIDGVAVGRSHAVAGEGNGIINTCAERISHGDEILGWLRC